MRILKDQTGVEAPSVNYPKGRIVALQTLCGEAVNGDIIQFFQKLVYETDITENGLPDNESNGYQLLQALEAYVRTLSANTSKLGVSRYADQTNTDKFLRNDLMISPATLGDVCGKLKTKVLEIGFWDMQSSSANSILHGLDINQIRSIKSVIIISDDRLEVHPLNFASTSNFEVAGTFYITSTAVVMARNESSIFNSVYYNANNINRGYITLEIDPNFV